MTLGKGVTTFIVSSTTSGAAACPRTNPVEKVAFTVNCFTASGVIWSSVLNLVLAKSFAGRTQSPLSSLAGMEPEGAGGAAVEAAAGVWETGGEPPQHTEPRQPEGEN